MPRGAPRGGGGVMPHLAPYLRLLQAAEEHLEQSFDVVAAAAGVDSEIVNGCTVCAQLSSRNRAAIAAAGRSYLTQRWSPGATEPDSFWTEPILQARPGPLGLLRDLHDLLSLTAFTQAAWTVVAQAAKALGDTELQDTCSKGMQRTQRQTAWLTTEIRATAPQTILVAS